MADFKYTPRDIYEIDFDTKMRGYDKDQVDEMLDGIIVDYETYGSELLKLQEENDFLKSRVAELGGSATSGAPTPKEQSAPVDLDQTQRFDPFNAQQSARPDSTAVAVPSAAAAHSAFVSGEPSNFELLKRINRLERAVFGSDSKYSDDTNAL